MYHATLYTLAAPQPVQKESGPLEMGTQRNVRDKLDVLGGSAPSFLLAMHPLRRVKTPALLTGDI